jgi:hypothetical protein
LADPDTTQWTEQLHDLVAYEVEAAYWRGREDGWEDHRDAMHQWAADYCATAPGAEPKPIDQLYEQTIQTLTHRITPH